MVLRELSLSDQLTGERITFHLRLYSDFRDLDNGDRRVIHLLCPGVSTGVTTIMIALKDYCRCPEDLGIDPCKKNLVCLITGDRDYLIYMNVI